METLPHSILRLCTKCSSALVLGDNWTEASLRNRGYLCRGCNAAKGRAFYAKNPKHVIEVSKARRHRNLPRIRSYWAEWRAENSERASEYSKSYQRRNCSDIDWRARKMLKMCKANAKHRNIQFDIPVEWFRDKLSAGVCEVTRISFDLEIPPRSERGSRTVPFAPSVDRIEQGGPYSVGNVRMVAFIYNVARSDFRDEDLLTLARALLAS